MLLNAARIPVWQWNDKDPSICPDCGEKLMARRSEFKIWHWAHYPLPKGATPRACHAEETAWRLQWKFAQMCAPGWEIEKRVMLEDKVMVLDAFNAELNTACVFVHSTSKQSLERFERLMRASFKTFWIYDGNKDGLGSARTRRRVWYERENGFTKCEGYQRMLKPAAMGLYKLTKGAVHRYEGLWQCTNTEPYRGWGKVKDVTLWSQLTGERAQAALHNFAVAKDTMEYLKVDKPVSIS